MTGSGGFLGFNPKTSFRKGIFCSTVALTQLPGCGSAKVDTGDNSEAPLRPAPVAPAGNGDCWAPAKTLRVPARLKSDFNAAMEPVCSQGKLVNLLRSDCGWDGSGPATDHIRVMKSTPVSDHDATDFEYLSAYALNAGPAPFSYPATLMLVALEPAKFRSAFEIPGGATITPDGRGSAFNGVTTRFRYNFEVNGMAKFGFTGDVEIFRVDPNLVIVFNQAVENLEGLKVRRNMTIVSKLDDGREKLVSVEQRLVPDMGQHQIALAKMLKLDQIEMENRYMNSKVREAPPELARMTF
ncbi:hypothetical protein EBZ80_06420 [bacterium]|nr:hypothetical protein [bacterium]